MNILDLIISDKTIIHWGDVVLDQSIKKQLEQIVKEHQHVDALTYYQLPVNHKILLYGPSGCGKTMTAKALAHALGKPILILNLSNVVNARIGETAQNIKQVFDKASREGAVLFLDEFDLIGKARDSDDKDVGEMRRLVNALIQLMDYFPTKAVLVAATNHPEMVDVALMRRFQLRLGFDMPDESALDSYYDQLLMHLPDELKHIERKYGLSFAEAKDYAYTIVKAALIVQLEQTSVVL